MCAITHKQARARVRAHIVTHNMNGYAQIGAFAEEYFKLFKNGDRPDLGDRGAEYRSLIGLPGGAYVCAPSACERV